MSSYMSLSFFDNFLAGGLVINMASLAEQLLLQLLTIVNNIDFNLIA